MSAPPSYDKSAYADPSYQSNLTQQYGFPQQQQYGPPQQQQYGPPQQQQYGPPPPQYGFAPSGNQVAVVASPQLGRDPVTTTCPHCGARVTTIVDTEAGTVAWVSAAVLCTVFCFVAWVPLCMDSLKDTTHRCPNCNALIGRYKANL